MLMSERFRDGAIFIFTILISITFCEFANAGFSSSFQVRINGILYKPSEGNRGQCKLEPTVFYIGSNDEVELCRTRDAKVYMKFQAGELRFYILDWNTGRHGNVTSTGSRSSVLVLGNGDELTINAETTGQFESVAIINAEDVTGVDAKLFDQLRDANEAVSAAIHLELNPRFGGIASTTRTMKERASFRAQGIVAEIEAQKRRYRERVEGGR